MRQCEICGKSYLFSVSYKKVKSKWNPVNRKKVKANLQSAKLESGKKIKACASCIRTLSKPERMLSKKSS